MCLQIDETKNQEYKWREEAFRKGFPCLPTTWAKLICLIILIYLVSLCIQPHRLVLLNHTCLVWSLPSDETRWARRTWARGKGQLTCSLCTMKIVNWCNFSCNGSRSCTKMAISCYVTFDMHASGSEGPRKWIPCWNPFSPLYSDVGVYCQI